LAVVLDDLIFFGNVKKIRFLNRISNPYLGINFNNGINTATSFQQGISLRGLN